MSYDSPLKYTSEREQYLLLSQQLRKLEDMFDLQQSDHQQLLRSIEELQQKIEQLTDENSRLHGDLSESEVLRKETEAELSTLRELHDKKDSVISRLKDELKSASQANAKSITEQRSLQEQIVRLNQEQEKLLRDYEVLMDQCDRVNAVLEQQSGVNARLKGELETVTGKWVQAQREMEAQAHRAGDHEYMVSAVQTKYEAAVLTIKDLKREIDSAKDMAVQAQQDVRRLQEAKEQAQSLQQKLKSDNSGLEQSLSELQLSLGRKDEELSTLYQKYQQLQTSLQNAGKLQTQVGSITQLLESKEATVLSQEQDLQLLERANRDLETENRDLQKQLRTQAQEITKLAQVLEAQKQQLRSLAKSEDSLKKYMEKKERMLDMRAQAEQELRSALESVDISNKRISYPCLSKDNREIKEFAGVREDDRQSFKGAKHLFGVCALSRQFPELIRIPLDFP